MKRGAIKKIVAFIVVTLFYVNLMLAQTIIDGTVTDAEDSSVLPGASIKLISSSDTTVLLFTSSDNDGKFEFVNVKKGSYKINVNYIGYKLLEKQVETNNPLIHLGIISLSKNVNILKDVSIIQNLVRVEQKNDTAEYNAKAFKTNKDATAEDLVTKMPGITSEGGTVKAHGEEIKKVTIDGKEFFGDDATLALKSLPSEIVDRIQVFDRMSDQSAFTGFDDGNSQKTLNILTKGEVNNSVFGKLYAGYGYLTDSRYSAGGNINWFNGARRLTVIGMSNNVNQQNFSSQDLLGVTDLQRGPVSFGGRSPSGRGGGGYMGNSLINNFMVGQLGGNSTTHSLGVNYTDVFGKHKNIRIAAGYFFNSTDNTNKTELNRRYIFKNDSIISYHENNSTESRNANHRINVRLEYSIDSMSAVIFTPRFNYQSNSQYSITDGQNTLQENIPLSRTQSEYKPDNSGYNISGDLLFQHKFKKLYRTLSVDIGMTINNKYSNASQTALNSFSDSGDSVSIDLKSKLVNTSYKVNGNISYTEPAGKNGMLQFSYEPTYTWNKSDKETWKQDTTSFASLVPDTSLSSKYDNDYMTHKISTSLRLKGEQYNLMMGVGGQFSILTGLSSFPYSVRVNRNFYNVLPILTFSYRFNNSSSLRVVYRTLVNPPSISQLQNVVDNSNPLLLSTGNPDLKQSFGHFVMTRFGFTNTKNGQTFFAFTSFNYTQNFIGNSTIIATGDTVLNNEIILHSGSQLKKPTNQNGNLNANSFFTYGFPVTKIKFNFNLNAGFSFSRTPGLINNLINLSDNYGISGGLVLSSNINEKIDFTISYSGSYNIVRNNLQTNADNNYFTHNANARITWQFWKGFIFNTALRNTLYQGISSGYNQNIFLWNAAFGYKFLKDQSLDVRISVNDILNQNSGVSRNVTETYIEDSKTQVLQRYLLLTVTYTLKQHLKKK